MVRETMVGDPFSRCNVDNTRIRDEEYLRNYYVRKMVSGNLVMLEARVYKRDPWIKVGVPSLVLRLWPANKRLFTRAKRREEEKLGGI